MSAFNPFQDQQFCGRDSLRFFTDMAPRRVMLDQYSAGMRDQGRELACTGEAVSVQLAIFSGYRGVPLDPSWSFIYWVGRLQEQQPVFSGADSGVLNCANVFKALYFKGACLQSLAADLDAGAPPSPEAFADAATRKVTLFERVDLFDCKNAVITALAHGIPVTGQFAVTYAFNGITSKDPAEQMALYNLPTGRIGAGFPEFLTYHYLTIVGYDLDLGCIFVHNSEGPSWADNGIGAVSFGTMVAQMRQAYAVREFAGLTSHVDPKWIVAGNANHDAAAMLNIRRAIVNVFANTEMTPLHKSQAVRGAMAFCGVTAQDLADAVEPWGITLPEVEAFLRLSA